MYKAKAYSTASATAPLAAVTIPAARPLDPFSWASCVCSPKGERLLKLVRNGPIRSQLNCMSEAFNPGRDVKRRLCIFN
jgi:hypothetical protein